MGDGGRCWDATEVVDLDLGFVEVSGLLARTLGAASRVRADNASFHGNGITVAGVVVSGVPDGR